MLQRVAVCCNVLQYRVVHCSVIESVDKPKFVVVRVVVAPQRRGSDDLGPVRNTKSSVWGRARAVVRYCLCVGTGTVSALPLRVEGQLQCTKSVYGRAVAVHFFHKNLSVHGLRRRG